MHFLNELELKIYLNYISRHHQFSGCEFSDLRTFSIYSSFINFFYNKHSWTMDIIFI